MLSPDRGPPEVHDMATELSLLTLALGPWWWVQRSNKSILAGYGRGQPVIARLARRLPPVMLTLAVDS